MRRQHAFILFACLAVCVAVAPPARTQDPGLQAYYWPHRTVGIPVNVAEIAKLNNKPTDLQLYYAINSGAFQKGPRSLRSATCNRSTAARRASSSTPSAMATTSSRCSSSTPMAPPTRAPMN